MPIINETAPLCHIAHFDVHFQACGPKLINKGLPVKLLLLIFQEIRKLDVQVVTFFQRCHNTHELPLNGVIGLNIIGQIPILQLLKVPSNMTGNVINGKGHVDIGIPGSFPSFLSHLVI
jgi:hypothetical protein